MTLPKTGGATLALIALSIGATAVQSHSSAAADLKAADGDARSATAALARHNPDAAIRFAEHAVQLRPQDATYRALLGKAYLAGGRFVSARQAYADALALDAGTPGAALNAALATTATGDFAAAHQILDDNAATIAPADRGLALALAGDPAGGVDVLTNAARGPDVTAKTRQNLALALALAGRWPEARQMALADLSPADADARIVQWAQFARPAAASDQVSSLLGVTPVADDGQPVALALVAAPTAIAAIAPAAPSAPVAVSPTPAAWHPDTPAADTAATVPPIADQAVAATDTAPHPSVGIVFAARSEVVQRVPVAAPGAPSAPRAPVRDAVARAAPNTTVRGSFVVQLGAFRGTDAARTAWSRVRSRHAVLAGKAPSTMPVANGLVRVSVGGFGRSDAVAICQSVRAGGGVCFVRTNLGDRVASWARRGVQVAVR